MFNFRKKRQKLIEAISRGAVIIDVRSENEFAGGHIEKARNYSFGTTPF